MHFGLPSLSDSPLIFGLDEKVVGKTIVKIGIIVFFGAFGGFVNGVSKLIGRIEAPTAGDEGQRPPWKQSLSVGLGSYLLLQTVVGSGGAFAAVFGILTIGNATRAAGSSDITVNPIYLVALCVVGGFVGNRLLIQVGKNLEDHVSKREFESELSRVNKSVSKVEQKAEELANKAPKMALDVDAAKKLVKMLEDCRANLSHDAALQRLNAEKERAKATRLLESLEEHLVAFPRERVLNIVSANLAFEIGLALGDDEIKDQGFQRLRNFIKARRDVGLPESDDDETAQFNLACYYAVLSDRAQRGKEEPLHLAFVAFRESLEIAERREGDCLVRRLAMHTDPELRPLFGTPQGAKLVADFTERIHLSLRPQPDEAPEPE